MAKQRRIGSTFGTATLRICLATLRWSGMRMKRLSLSSMPFTFHEYRGAMQSLRVGKSCGEDRVSSEVLKWVNIDDLVLGICNRVLEHRELPGQWTNLNIIPIPKAGDLRNRDNYRAISLCSVVAKVYNKMKLYRMKPPLDSLLRLNQNGVREGRSTTAQVLVLRRLIEGVKQRNLTAVIMFVDFKNLTPLIRFTEAN